MKTGVILLASLVVLGATAACDDASLRPEILQPDLGGIRVLAPSRVDEAGDTYWNKEKAKAYNLTGRNPAAGFEAKRYDEVVKFPFLEAYGSMRPSTEPRFTPPPGISKVRAVHRRWDPARPSYTGPSEVVWEWSLPERLQPDNFPKWKYPQWALSEAFDERGEGIARYGAVCLYGRGLDPVALMMFDASNGYLWTTEVPVRETTSKLPPPGDDDLVAEYSASSTTEAPRGVSVSVSPSGHRVALICGTVPRSSRALLFILDGRTGKMLRTVAFRGYRPGYIVDECRGERLSSVGSDRFLSALLSKVVRLSPETYTLEMEPYVLDWEGRVLCRTQTPTGAPVIVMQFSSDDRWAFGMRSPGAGGKRYTDYIFDLSSLQKQ